MSVVLPSYPPWKVCVLYYIFICGPSGCTIFSSLPHKWQNFQEKNLNIKCMFYFIYKFLSFWQELRKTLSQMYIGSHVKYLLFLIYFNQNWIFLNRFFKNPQTSNSWKPVLWELSCSILTDGQTGKQQTDRETWWSYVTFCNFANMPNNL